MNRTFLLALLGTILMGVISCSEICEGECFEEPVVYFNIYDKIDSTDLVLGINNAYELADLKAFSIHGEDTIQYQIELYNSPIITNPTLKLDYLNFSNPEVFLDLGQQDIDTFQFTFQDISAECCYETIRINTLKYNRSEVYNRTTDQFLIEIYK